MISRLITFFLLLTACILFSIPANAQSVKVFDNSGGTSGDLTGQTDFDSIDQRNLTIYWDAPQGDATNWHVYVQKGLGGSKYLGQTGTGNANTLDWNSSNPLIEEEFANGPDFNAAYTFRVIRLDGNLTSDDYIDQQQPVGFNVTGGNPVSLTLSAEPNFKSEKVSIFDDLLGGDDLAPMASSGSDRDSSDERAIQIAWNFGVDPSEVNEYHVQVSIDGGPFEFLGQTYNSNLNYFWWTPNKEFRTHDTYADGPQDGNTYQFNIILRALSGPNQSMTSGTLQYSVTQEEPTPVPTPIQPEDLFFTDFDSLDTLADGGMNTLDNDSRDELLAQGRLPALNFVVPWFIFDASAENQTNYGVAKSNGKSAAFNSDFGFYENAQTSILEIIQTFDTTAANSPKIAFDIAFAFEEPYSSIKDYLVVELLRSGETEYELLDINGDGTITTDKNAVGTVLETGTFDGFFDTSNAEDEAGQPLGEEDFIHFEANLPQDTALKIVFRFESDSSVASEGAYIDNLRIYDAEPSESGSTPTPAPASTSTPTPNAMSAPPYTPTPTPTPIAPSSP